MSIFLKDASNNCSTHDSWCCDVQNIFREVQKMAMYQAQLKAMVMWMDQWNESGQSVAMFQMLTRLGPIPARFVSIALDYSLKEVPELALQEKEANNPEFIHRLLLRSKEDAMTQLLIHLPLLQPGNLAAKLSYLNVVPKVLSYSTETGSFVEQARQLLAYVLIHPALKDDRTKFEHLRHALEEKIANGSTSKQFGFGNGGTGFGDKTVMQEEKKKRQERSNSLTPPFGVTPSSELSTSQDDISIFRGKNRRFSLSEHSGGPPLSPQSQTSSGSGSETHLDDSKFPDGYSPGMKDVQIWLKSLRLHKYTRLFMQLTYEKMLSLDEETFDATIEQIGAGPVTQGAKRKIILSISKLRDRYSNLCQLEQDVMKGGNLLNAMDTLKGVLGTPMKPASSDDKCNTGPSVVEDDIPSQFTKVLGKICTQLMVTGRGDDEALSCFISLLDKTYHHDSFTSPQKRKISYWRSEIAQQQRQLRPDQLRYPQQNLFLHPSASSAPGARFPMFSIPPNNAFYQQSQFNRNNSLSVGSSSLCPTSLPQQITSTTTSSLLTNTSGFRGAAILGTGVNNNAAIFHSKRPSLQDHPLLELGGESYTNVPRAQSAPNTETDPEINSRLESLCIQMTEQALGGPSEM